MLHRYRRAVQFRDTDAMGVVHHSMMVLYFEEARVDWLRKRDRIFEHSPNGDWGLAVVRVECQYKKPLRFGDEFEVCYQIQLDRLRVRFQYKVCKVDDKNDIVAIGFTDHVPVDNTFKLTKLPKDLLQEMEKEPWTEIWP